MFHRLSPSVRRVAQPGFMLCLGRLGCSSGHLSVGDNRSVADPGSPAAVSAGTGRTEPTAEAVLPLLAACTHQISHGLLAPRSGHVADVPICSRGDALFWKSELAVDCDGKQTETCNPKTDPQYQGETTGRDSSGDPLDATAVAYVEVPARNAVFDYSAAGLSIGSVAAVIYNGRLAYGVLGHEQAAGQIGAGSVALASRLNIDPDPKSGGLESEVVTYIAFVGVDKMVSALEDEAATTALAKGALEALLQADP